MTELDQKLLEHEINWFKLDIPANVFHFEFNRSEAEHYLTENPSIPFIIRDSSIQGYFAIDFIGTSDRFSHLLILPPTEDQLEYKLYHYENSTFCEDNLTLRAFIEKLCMLHEKQLKVFNNVKTKFAVLSIQSLDGTHLDGGKLALNPKQVQEYALRIPSLKFNGDGHTGFAMAKALYAPFVVLRSKENREAANKVSNYG